METTTEQDNTTTDKVAEAITTRDESIDGSCNCGQESTVATQAVVTETPKTETTAKTTTTTPKKKVPRKIIRRKQKQQQDNKDEYKIDTVLYEKVMKDSNLPVAYTFEIIKTVQRCMKLNVNHIALQMPEGLLLFATIIADILKQLTPCLQQVSILGDVTYGACCIDDITAQQLGCQLLVHYGHSCLIPIQHTVIPVLYVFVEIQFNVEHMVKCLLLTLSSNNSNNINNEDEIDSTITIYLLGTVQFRHALGIAKDMIIAAGYTNVIIPQVKPLSPGEVLGCTSPKLDDNNNNNNAVCCFVADGRFHLEATLISNPHINQKFYRYDPYTRTLTKESYDHIKMKQIRYSAIQKAMHNDTKTFGIILGTLGRQGNPAIVQRIRDVLDKHQKRYFIILLSEITPSKLATMKNVDCWVQVACPRLSVDWGHFLSNNNIPVLNSYELFVSFQETEWNNKNDYYPMDYYSQTGGPWSNYYDTNRNRQMK